MYQKIELNKKVIWAVILLPFISSLLLSLPFMVKGTGIVALVAFVPLFAAEQIARDYKIRYFWTIYYTAFLIWNLITTWWVYLATPPGAIAAFLLNSLQMSFVFALFRRMRNRTEGFLPYLFLISAWLAWEHCYHNWQVSWPWLVLGNSFATSLPIIQWYEYTGVLGGSLWVLLTNALVFRAIMTKIKGEHIRLSFISIALLVVLPIIASLVIWFSYDSKYDPKSRAERSNALFSIVQPNIDPYTDKFGGMSQREQTTLLLNLSDEALKNLSQEAKRTASGTMREVIMLSPETFLSPDGTYNSHLIKENPLANPSFARIYDFAARNDVNYIVGAVAYHLVENASKPETSNSSVMIYRDGGVSFYNKSKLVILAESTPFTGILKPLERLAIDLGGAVGSFTPQKERSIFTTPGGIKVGTAICYESVYGDFYRDYILKGADVMAIITNDGWWGNTAGHRQHLNYASLRAIENRRSIARCANTGISAFIDERGRVLESSSWWESEYLSRVLPLNSRITFFTANGDVIGRVSLFLFALLFIMGVVRALSARLSPQGRE